MTTRLLIAAFVCAISACSDDPNWVADDDDAPGSTGSISGGVTGHFPNDPSHADGGGTSGGATSTGAASSSSESGSSSSGSSGLGTGSETSEGTGTGTTSEAGTTQSSTGPNVYDGSSG